MWRQGRSLFMQYLQEMGCRQSIPLSLKVGDLLEEVEKAIDSEGSKSVVLNDSDATSLYAVELILSHTDKALKERREAVKAAAWWEVCQGFQKKPTVRFGSINKKSKSLRKMMETFHGRTIHKKFCEKLLVPAFKKGGE